MAFISPQNNIVVTIAQKYIGNYSNIMKAANLNPGSQLNPAELVNIVGTVVSVPRSINSTRPDYKGYSAKDIQPGDTLIFRFDVVFDMEPAEYSDVPLYRNMVWYKGKEYWVVDIQKAFAVIREGEIIMLNGYCMLENLSKKGTIVMPASMKRITNAGSATLTNIGNPLEHLKKIDAKPGDTVYYNPNIVQEYQIKEKKFGIIKQTQILGKSDPILSEPLILN